MEDRIMIPKKAKWRSKIPLEYILIEKHQQMKQLLELPQLDTVQLTIGVIWNQHRCPMTGKQKKKMYYIVRWNITQP